MRRGIDRIPRPDVDIDFESFESITDVYEAIGTGVIEFHGPEFEEPSFGEFLWEEVVLGGLFRASAEIEITISECEICVGIGLDISLYETAQGKGPRVCYRFAECKEEEKDVEEDPPPPPPPLNPSEQLPSRSPPSFSNGGILSWCTSSQTTQRYFSRGKSIYQSSSVNCGEWVGDAKKQQENSTYIPAGGKFESYENITQTQNIYIREQYWVYAGVSSRTEEEIEGFWENAQENGTFIGCANFRNRSLVFWLATEYFDIDGLKYSTWNSPGLSFVRDSPFKAPAPGGGGGVDENGDDDMSCCKNQRDNDALLKKIYQELVKARKDIDDMGEAVGIDDFPATVPKYLTEDSGTRKIKSIPQFQGYLVEQLDALVGEFPIEIEIEDTDPTQSGNQTEKVKLPNLAESIAEIYGLLTKTAIDGDVSLNFLTRLAFELSSVKAATLLAQSYARGNAAYLGYQGNLDEFEVQSAFNIDSDELGNLEDFLQEKKLRLSSWVNEDKNTVQGYLERLMFSASIIKQVYVKNDGNSTAAKMIELVGKAALDGVGSRAWEDFMKYLNTEGFVGRTSNAPQPSAKNINLE